MQVKETNIRWINWMQMNREAGINNEAFAELPYVLIRKIEDKCKRENVIEWAEDDLYEGCNFDPTVLYSIRNTEWPWDVMMKDLLELSAEYPDMILEVTFIEGSAEAKTYICGGRLTAVLYDEETGELIKAF